MLTAELTQQLCTLHAAVERMPRPSQLAGELLALMSMQGAAALEQPSSTVLLVTQAGVPAGLAALQHAAVLQWLAGHCAAVLQVWLMGEMARWQQQGLNRWPAGRMHRDGRCCPRALWARVCM